MLSQIRPMMIPWLRSNRFDELLHDFVHPCHALQSTKAGVSANLIHGFERIIVQNSGCAALTLVWRKYDCYISFRT
jgi:hypothetical protein